MRHEKEWHTCDRCGVEIEFKTRSFFLKKVYRIGGMFCGRGHRFKETCDFDLCPKCSEDFERFMRNE